jgi:flagellar hook protein FlgE
MSRALLAAVSGLRANQLWIDVIGANIANGNTNGFKASRALFSSLLSQTFSAGGPPSNNLGGTNPNQIGLGAQVATIDRVLNQGAISFTGRPFDLAMSGAGWFTVNDGSQDLYTRNGTFGLDAASQMVDLRTGYRVLGSDGQAITLDTAATLPPQETGEVTFTGNLPAEVGGPLAEVLATGAALESGTSAEITGTQAGPFAVPDGETWTMEIALDGQSAQEIAVTSSGGTVTAQEIADEINLELGQDIATVDLAGQLVLQSNKSGLASTVLVVPGSSGSDLASLTGLSTTIDQGAQDPATTATDLNELVANEIDYEVGDVIRATGTDATGNPIDASFTYGADGTTVGDLVAFLDGLYPDASASFDADAGTIQVTADEKGEAQLSLLLSDGSSQTGSTNWAQVAFGVETDGTGPDQVTTSIQVYDPVGVSHLVSFTFERQADGSWAVAADLPDENGVVLTPDLPPLQFDANGELPGPVTLSLQVQFDGQPLSTIELEMGGNDDFSGLTEYGSEATVLAADQDGFGVGELAALSVDTLGNIVGAYTNGQSEILATLGIATFANDAGLSDEGNSYFARSQNSGDAQVGNGSAGQVIGGALESSNVETAEEFVSLIQAQRGFQANARIISIQDNMLEEAVNLI